MNGQWSENMYKVVKTKLEGCIELVPNIFEDNRGISVKHFHQSTFEKIGIQEKFQEDLMVISKKGVFRGLHFQQPPFAQAKLVYCIKGKIQDVVLDIRKSSLTYGKYQIIELSSQKMNSLYIPNGFAHGYLTVEDQSIVMYKMSSEYKPEAEGGIRWDSLGICWDVDNVIISERDRSFMEFSEFKSKFMGKW